jgi:hypothetical protein
MKRIIFTSSEQSTKKQKPHKSNTITVQGVEQDVIKDWALIPDDILRFHILSWKSAEALLALNVKLLSSKYLYCGETASYYNLATFIQAPSASICTLYPLEMGFSFKIFDIDHLLSDYVNLHYLAYSYHADLELLAINYLGERVHLEAGMQQQLLGSGTIKTIRGDLTFTQGYYLSSPFIRHKPSKLLKMWSEVDETKSLKLRFRH